MRWDVSKAHPELVRRRRAHRQRRRRLFLPTSIGSRPNLRADEWCAHSKSSYVVPDLYDLCNFWLNALYDSKPKSVSFSLLSDGEIPMPKNVHVIPDYMTFEKEIELHEGRDAYPNQDIIVSSLREKGKYKSVRKPKCPWEEAQGFDLPVRYGRHKGFWKANCFTGFHSGVFIHWLF